LNLTGPGEKPTPVPPPLGKDTFMRVVMGDSGCSNGCSFRDGLKGNSPTAVSEQADDVLGQPTVILLLVT